MKLSRRRWQFDKIELVGADVIILVDTWYARSDVLSCTPYSRQTWHFLLLIQAITGCRTGCLREMKYKDFQIFLLRDPKDRARFHVGAEITLDRNKQKQGSLYVKEK